MKKAKIVLVTFIILMNAILTTGCWNYREVDELSIVAGVAVDKGVKNQFKLTTEVIQISGGKDIKATSKTITTEGKSMFDAARNMIALSGKKLYWAHTKVIILSKKIARNGIKKVIEWYNRDSETREDPYILISMGESAKEIFKGQSEAENIKSFVLNKIVTNQGNLSKAPITNVLKYDIESKTKGISVALPSVKLKQINGKRVLEVMGSAIIKNDKLVGFLNGEETKNLLFIRNEIKGGLLIEKPHKNDLPKLTSLEIFKSKTKVTPVVNGKNIKINLNINTTTAIDEIDGSQNFLDDKVRKKMEQSAANELKKQIKTLINKMQLKYDADIFGFGAKVWEDAPQAWNAVEKNWKTVFKTLKINVKTKVHIRNSAALSKSL